MSPRSCTVSIGPLALAAAMAATGASIGATEFVVIDLGTIAGPDAASPPGSYALGMNGAAVVVGSSVGADGTGITRAFRFQDGVMTALEPIGGRRHSVAAAVDSAGGVVGTSYDLGALDPQAVRWSAAGAVLLGTFQPSDVNDVGVVVGRRALEPDHAHMRAVALIGGVLVDLGTLGGDTAMAHAVSESGRIVGTSLLANGQTRRAFLWQSGAPMRDLGTLGGVNSHAYGVNDAGQIVGFSETAAGAPRATLFTVDAAGSVLSRTDLGALGRGFSYALAINASGEIVGTAGSRAFVWRAGIMEDLNDLIPPGSGWTLERAVAITDGGAIAGAGLHLGKGRAFLLRPIVAGDVDQDGDVDFQDLLIVLSEWGPCSPPCPADVDGDGTVGFQDLLVILSNWS
jgi:probable HAF family extracellular repeat protein